MTFFLAKVVGFLLFGNFFVDGPEIPPLDTMMEILFGFKTYTGITHMWPLLLTHVPAPESEPELEPDDLVLLQLQELALWLWRLTTWQINNQSVPYNANTWQISLQATLGWILYGCLYMVLYYYWDYIDNFGWTFPPVIQGDDKYKKKVMRTLKRKFSARKYSPQNGQGLGRLVHFFPEGSEKEFVYEDFYALKVMPALMDEIRRSSFWTIAFVKWIFFVNTELSEDFILLNGTREGVTAAYIYLRRSYGP